MPKVEYVLLSFILLLAIWSTSCNQKGGPDYRIVSFSDFDILATHELRGRKHSYKELVFPVNLLLVDSLLVISERESSRLIHVIDPYQGRYLKSIGRFGDGLGESGSIAYFLPGKTPKVFWTYNAERKEISCYNLSDSSGLPLQQIRQGGDFLLAVEVAWASDSTVLTTLADGDEKFIEFSIKGKRLRSWGSWRTMINQSDVPASVISSVHQGTLRASLNGNFFLLACRNRDLIEVLDRASGTITSIRGPDNNMPKFKIDYSAGYPMPVLERNRRLYYHDGFFGSEYIYVLYSGNYTTDIRERSDYNRVIYVFNYKGAVVARFLMDYSVYNVVVDEESGKIFGLTFDAEPNLVEFDLPMF